MFFEHTPKNHTDHRCLRSGTLKPEGCQLVPGAANRSRFSCLPYELTKACTYTLLSSLYNTTQLHQPLVCKMVLGSVTPDVDLVM
jgi:hypothetical protein